MTTKEKFEFNLDEVEKVTKKFRANLKLKDFKLIMKYKNFEFLNTQLLELKVNQKSTGLKLHFSISSVSKHIIRLELQSTTIPLDGQFIVDYAKELANSFGSSLLIIQQRDSEIVVSKGLKMLKDKDRISALTSSYSSLCTYYYINLVDDYYENRVVTEQIVEEQLAKYKAQDITFTSNRKKSDNGCYAYDYYYKGYEGDFEIHFNEKVEFHAPKFNIIKEISVPLEIKYLLDSLMEKSYFHAKDESLINPPSKHFKTFFLKNIIKNEELAEQVFDLITMKVSPDKVELDIIELGSKLYQLYDKDNSIYLVKLFNLYFVLDNKKIVSTKYDDFNIAKLVYEKEVELREYENYKTRINLFKRKMSFVEEN